MKLKNKIRDKLRAWLFETELKDLQKATIQMQIARNQYSEAYRLANDCHQLMNSMMDVGTDIHLHSDHSWAVVCIKGHPEYVSFIPLSHRDAHEVLEVLKRFRYSNRVIDSPFAFRDMVDHCIMENPFGK
jgi:hypothetical protein